MSLLSEILTERITRGAKSKASVAAHLGVSERTIENYMQGKRSPRPEALALLSKFLGFSLDELSNESGVQNVPPGNGVTGNLSQNKKSGDRPDWKQIAEERLKVIEAKDVAIALLKEKAANYESLINKVEFVRGVVHSHTEKLQELLNFAAQQVERQSAQDSADKKGRRTKDAKKH